jgi:signal transduction histidine kinase/DNA-binding response OmpR family regulator
MPTEASPSDHLAVSSPDGRYSFEAVRVERDLWRVTEVGRADEATGTTVVDLLAGLVDVVEARQDGSKVWFCADYTRYGGIAPRARYAMLRRVIGRGGFGGVAFLDGSFAARAQAALLTTIAPGLHTRAFASEAEAMDWLRARIAAADGDGGAAVTEVVTRLPMPPRLQDLHTFEEMQAGGVRWRWIRPPDWRLQDAAQGCETTWALTDDGILVASHAGPLDSQIMQRAWEVEERVAQEARLGTVRLALDLRGATYTYRTQRDVVRAYRRREARYERLVLIHGERDLLGKIASAAAPLLHSRLQTAPSVEQAIQMLRGSARSASESVVPIPSGGAALRAFARAQQEELAAFRASRQRLFDHIAALSWDRDTWRGLVPLPEGVDPADPLYPPFAALQVFQEDLGAMLEERDRREAELAQARAQAEAAGRARSEFLGVVSHELRTPLTAITGLTELLACSSLTPEQRRFVEVMGGAADRLSRLVDDLLDFTHLEAGALRVDQAAFDLSALLDEIDSFYRRGAAGRGLEFTLSVEPELPGRVLGDRMRLLQVLTNLLDNALKFTSQGRVELLVRRDTGAGIRFCVSDTGRGIAREDIGRVFLRFERGAQLPGEVVPGVGLGLPICRELVRLMGGAIELDSRVGQGTTVAFSLHLPAAAPAEATPSPDQPAPGSIRQRVLLVEDDPACRFTESALLERLGCLLTVATDGIEALEAYRPGAFDLILMDLQLPRLDGFEASRRIRAADPAAPPIVAVSAFTLDQGQQRVEAAGMSALLPKPLAPDDLVRLLRHDLPRLQGLRAQAGARSPRVLLVDDEPIVLAVVAEQLATLGACTVAFPSVAEAEAWDEPFDAAFIDLQLADGSGLDLAERLHRAGRCRHLWILSGFPLVPSQRARADVLGIGHLLKPVRLEALREVVRAVQTPPSAEARP